MTTTKLTIKDARATLRALGMTLTKDESGDFCVKPRGSYAGDDGYFTNDLQDAVDTGRVMYEKICRQIDQINKTVLVPFSYPNETSHSDR